MPHAGVLQQRVELFSAALAPQPHRLQYHVHADLVPVAEAVGEGLLRVVYADGSTIELVRLDALVERWPREPEEARRRIVEARLPRPTLERDVSADRAKDGPA